MYIKIGDKDVEYNKNFRLFLHTKLSKPHYPPEIQAETTLITFAVTEQVSSLHSGSRCCPSPACTVHDWDSFWRMTMPCAFMTSCVACIV